MYRLQIRPGGSIFYQNGKRGSWWQWVCEEDECQGKQAAFFHKTRELANEEYGMHWHRAHGQ